MGRSGRGIPSTLVTHDAIMCCCGQNFYGNTARVKYAYKLHRKICKLLVDDESDLIDKMNDVNRANFNANSRQIQIENTFIY